MSGTRVRQRKVGHRLLQQRIVENRMHTVVTYRTHALDLVWTLGTTLDPTFGFGQEHLFLGFYCNRQQLGLVLLDELRDASDRSY